MRKDSTVTITEKGKAWSIAYECGLFPEGGEYSEAFDRFWDEYIKYLHKKILRRETLIALVALIISVIALLNSLPKLLM